MHDHHLSNIKKIKIKTLHDLHTNLVELPNYLVGFLFQFCDI
jgi:hypothetical protein